MFPGICKRQSWCWQQKTRIHVLLMRAEGGVRRNGGGPLQWPCWTYEYKREKLPQNEKKGGDITFILSQLFWLPWICLLFLQLLRCVRFFVTISMYYVCGERVIRMQEELRRISLSRILGSCISYLFNIPSLIHQNGFMLDIQYFFKSIFIHFFTQMPGATICPIFTLYFMYSLVNCPTRLPTSREQRNIQGVPKKFDDRIFWGWATLGTSGQFGHFWMHWTFFDIFGHSGKF